MKIRILSSIAILLLFIPIIITGGGIYNFATCILGLISLNEFIQMKEIKKKLPDFIKYVSFIVLILLVFIYTNINSELLLDYRIIVGVILVYLLPTVLYHDSNKYSINDAFYLIGGLFFLGFSFQLLILVRNLSLELLVFLLLITTVTDTFAYFTGYLIGKKHLLPEISPKKTWEGLFGGIFMGVLISSIFYLNIINPNINIYFLIISVIFLSLLGQLGDLVFSAIKRYFGKKDFSSIIPGHGGVLDRLDSIIFVLLGFMFFIGIL